MTNLNKYTLIGLKSEYFDIHSKIKNAYANSNVVELDFLTKQLSGLIMLETEILKLDPTFNKPEIPF